MSNLWSLAVTMGVFRMISGLIEFSAGSFMIFFNNIETALKINALLVLIGPTVMVIVTSLGLIGISGQISPGKMLTIFSGTALIFIGLHKM